MKRVVAALLLLALLGTAWALTYAMLALIAVSLGWHETNRYGDVLSLPTTQLVVISGVVVVGGGLLLTKRMGKPTARDAE